MSKVLLCVAIVMALFASCGTDAPLGTILPQGVELKTGDVVLRRGGGVVSRVVIVADQGGHYSHVGIVVNYGGRLMVVHAVPGEQPDSKLPDMVKMDTPEDFFLPQRASMGCVMRQADSVAARRAAQYAIEVWRRGTEFDHDYDDADTTKMYCCELVENAYAAAGHPLVTAPRHSFYVPVKHLPPLMMPSDFRLSPRLSVVIEFGAK